MLMHGMRNERNGRMSRAVDRSFKKRHLCSVSTVTNEMIIFVSVIFINAVVIQFHFHRINVCSELLALVHCTAFYYSL